MTKAGLIEAPFPRNLFFTKQVNQDSIAELTNNIIAIENNDQYLKRLYKIHNIKYTPKPIIVYIDSYGGAVYQCFGLLSVMERCKTPIHTIVTGAAMSCGFMMLICGHKRFAHKLSTPLYHQVSSSRRGTTKELEEGLKETKRLQKAIEKITLKKTNITKKQLKKIYEKKVDWFMNAKDALRYGVIDEILE